MKFGSGLTTTQRALEILKLANPYAHFAGKAHTRVVFLEKELANMTENLNTLYCAIRRDAIKLKAVSVDCEKWHKIAQQQAQKLIDMHHFLENFTAAPLLSWVKGIAMAKYGRHITADNVYFAINHLVNTGCITPVQYEFLYGSLSEPVYVPGRLSPSEEDHNKLFEAVAKQSVEYSQQI